MNTKHTPGPWEKSGDKIMSKDVCVCLLYKSYKHNEFTPSINEFTANADLIASAPETAAKLEEVTRERDEILSALNHITSNSYVIKGVSDKPNSLLAEMYHMARKMCVQKGEPKS